MVVSGGIVTPEDPNKNREAVSLTELSGSE
jgi:hypothetical protein